jgi:hypothetical protein
MLRPLETLRMQGLSLEQPRILSAAAATASRQSAGFRSIGGRWLDEYMITL